MKKMYLIPFAFPVIFVMACKKKEHTCFCETTYKSGTMQGMTVYYQESSDHTSRMKARSWCKDMETKPGGYGGVKSTRCSLTD